jgi:hypothetical protein
MLCGAVLRSPHPGHAALAAVARTTIKRPRLSGMALSTRHPSTRHIDVPSRTPRGRCAVGLRRSVRCTAKVAGEPQTPTQFIVRGIASAWSSLTHDRSARLPTYRSDRSEGPTAGTETVDPLEVLARGLLDSPKTGHVTTRYSVGAGAHAT